MSLLGLQRTGSGPVLVWLHGFTHTKDSGHRFRTILAGSRELVTIDLPGHGENAAVTASLDACADLIADLLPDAPCTLAGYSLGARVALHVALRHRERLRDLVLISGTAGIADDEERRARRERDEKLATHIEAVGAADFLTEWLAQPMFKTLPEDPLERAARSADASGLARSLRHAGTGTQRWLLPEVGALSVPTLVVSGTLDQKFDLEGDRLAAALPSATRVRIAGAGHAAHLERPEAVAALLA